MSENVNHSSQRIAQSGWIVLSVYLAFFLGHLVQNGLYPTFLGFGSEKAILPLMVLTLIFLILAMVESYVWLNPPREKLITGKQALFHFTHLIIVFAYTICKAFLTLALTNGPENPSSQISIWTVSLVFILILFSLYNFLWIIKFRVAPEKNDPKPKQALMYAGFYLIFAAAFIIHLLAFEGQSICIRSYTLVGLFSAYLVAYLWFWWDKWHSTMFCPDLDSLRGNIGSSTQKSENSNLQ